MRVDALNSRGTLVQADVSLQELSVGEALREAAAAEPDRLAVIDPASGRRLTYVELLAQSERVAHGLLERFSPGEHVAACMPNCCCSSGLRSLGWSWSRSRLPSGVAIWRTSSVPRTRRACSSRPSFVVRR